MKGSVPASVDIPKPGRKGQALVQPGGPITPALLSIPAVANMLGVKEAARLLATLRTTAQGSDNLLPPIIAAVEGFAMGGGFMLVESCDLRLAVREAVFEVSEAKRWLLGGYNHGHLANMPFPVAMEMALGCRFTAPRFYELGCLPRRVGAADQRRRDGHRNHERVRHERGYAQAKPKRHGSPP